MKLKDFIKVLGNIYNLTLYDDSDGSMLFDCKSDSKVLLSYEEWGIVEISVLSSLWSGTILEICIKEGVINNG